MQPFGKGAGRTALCTGSPPHQPLGPDSRGTEGTKAELAACEASVAADFGQSATGELPKVERLLWSSWGASQVPCSASRLRALARLKRRCAPVAGWGAPPLPRGADSPAWVPPLRPHCPWSQR